MGQSFTLYSREEATPTVEPPVEVPEWSSSEAYDFLYDSVLKESEKTPCTTQFKVDVPRPLTPSVQEEVLKRMSEYGWKVEVQGTSFQISLPISQSVFIPKSSYNVNVLYESILRDVQKLVREKPYENTHEVRIPVSFFKTFNEETDLQRQTIRTELLIRLQKLRWEVTLKEDHPFQTTLTIRLPPALPH